MPSKPYSPPTSGGPLLSSGCTAMPPSQWGFRLSPQLRPQQVKTLALWHPEDQQ